MNWISALVNLIRSGTLHVRDLLPFLISSCTLFLLLHLTLALSQLLVQILHDKLVILRIIREFTAVEVPNRQIVS